MNVQLSPAPQSPMIRSGRDSDRTGDLLAAVGGAAKDLLGSTWREWYVSRETKTTASSTAAIARVARGAAMLKGKEEKMPRRQFRLRKSFVVAQAHVGCCRIPVRHSTVDRCASYAWSRLPRNEFVIYRLRAEISTFRAGSRMRGHRSIYDQLRRMQ